MPGHVTDTGETGWSHSLGLVAFTHVLEARTRAGMGPVWEHHLGGEDVAGSLLSACSPSRGGLPLPAQQLLAAGFAPGSLFDCHCFPPGTPFPA